MEQIKNDETIYKLDKIIRETLILRNHLEHINSKSCNQFLVDVWNEHSVHEMDKAYKVLNYTNKSIREYISVEREFTADPAKKETFANMDEKSWLFLSHLNLWLGK